MFYGKRRGISARGGKYSTFSPAEADAKTDYKIFRMVSLIVFSAIMVTP